MSSNFSRIPPLTSELAALEHLKKNDIIFGKGGKNGIDNQQRVWLSRCIFRRPVSVIQDLFQDNDHVKICAEVLKNGKVKSRDPFCYKNR